MSVRSNAAVRARTARQLARNAFKRAELGVFCANHEPVIEAMAAAIDKRLQREDYLKGLIRWYESEIGKLKHQLEQKS